MTILDLYKERQYDEQWSFSFVSTAEEQYGKLFSCLNVNFRSIMSFYTHLDAFQDKIGKRREEWNNFQENTGQEKDKHRTVRLTNAGFIQFNNDRYNMTDKGNEALRANNSNRLSDKEKWILLFMLILDYKTNHRELDIIRSVMELVNELGHIGVNRIDFMRMLKDAANYSDKEDFFKSDVFWLITFHKDIEFTRRYLSSTMTEKQNLFDWVIECSKEKNPKDCVAKKFKPGGSYTAKTFRDEMNMALSVLILASIQDKSWEGYLQIVAQLYRNCDYNRLNGFIQENQAVYNNIYSNTFKLIQNIIGG